MNLTLAVLAAGLGSRYGGLKQLEAVGPTGETVLDYAVFDARRAGFDRVVFIIRRDFETEFRAQVGEKYANAMRVDYVFQSLGDLPRGFAPPLGRAKPWGTGHALWSARAAIDEPFVSINADDFYGRDSFARLAEFLRTEKATARPQFAMAGFRLANALSEHGAVARGVCDVTEEGALRQVTEQIGIQREDVGRGRTFSGHEIVSMNCWAFTPRLFALLDRAFIDHIRTRGADANTEFYLPTAISGMIAGRNADVQVLPTRATWFGVTYREDKERVMAALRQLVAVGEYPASLRLAFPSILTR